MPSHQPVLLKEVLRLLDPKPAEALLDLTAGYGGHSAAIMKRIGPRGRAILVDRDSHAIRALKQRFGDSAELIRDNYLDAVHRLQTEGALVDMVLLDLGVSSPQLDNSSRGFSFRADGPLDMRMDQSQSSTAEEVVNRYPVERLAKLIAAYGEERRAKSIAKAIAEARPLKTTIQLAEIVRSVAGRRGAIDPATRTFQAIRIEVNNELANLKEALPILVRLLVPGGRLAVISFHSLEDRIAKEFIARESKDCICPPKQPICTCGHQASLARLTTRAIKGEIDDNNNPRARSAKLRAAVKLKPKAKRRENK